MNDEVVFASPTRLEIERILTAPREKVWRYLVDPELRSTWFCGGATSDQPGGEIVLEFDHRRLSADGPPPEMTCDEQATVVGKVLRYEPPETLQFLWPGERGESSEVTITLGEVTGGTRLRLVHRKLSPRDDLPAAAAGWHAHLDLLSDRVGQQPVRDFWRRFSELQQAYATRDPRVESESDS